MVEEEKTLTSSFDGNIEEIPDIAVDNFTDKSKKAYFLSHMHTDHTVGLVGEFDAILLRNNGAKIYMSEKSKIILSHEYKNKFDFIEELVEPLKLEITYTINLAEGKAFKVTLIPVKHMVGAVMFLFKTKDKNVLFTGDFVIDKEETSTFRKLHDANGKPIYLDTLYIDSTFDNPAYKYFPSRTECHSTIVKDVQDWLDRKRGGVSLFSNYQFGYDDLYIALKKNLNMRIFLNSSTTCTLYDKLYGVAENPLTSDVKSKIHKCENRFRSESHDRCGITGRQNYLHIYMSAMRGYNYEPGCNNATVDEGNNTLYLCYPTHCSQDQLNKFKDHFKITNSEIRIVTFPVPVGTPKNKSPFEKDRDRDALRRERARRADADADSAKRTQHGREN